MYVIRLVDKRGHDDYTLVMAGLVPAIHVLLVATIKDVDARHKAGHDGGETARSTHRAGNAFQRHGRACPGHPRLVDLQ